MTPAERGRLGGRATLQKYGAEHFRRLGALGFSGLARRLGYTHGSRREALRQLVAAGRMRDLNPPDLTPDELTELARECGLDDDDV